MLKFKSRGSSVVEHSPEERLVVGPIPTSGTKTLKNSQLYVGCFLVIHKVIYKNRTLCYNEAIVSNSPTKTYPQMRKDKESAFALRKQGQSYKNISNQLNIPVGTLAGWFKDEPWSIEIRDRLANSSSFSSPKKLKQIAKANKDRWESWRENFRKEATTEFPILKKDPLFLAGIMLYWGEGSKSMGAGTARLTNSDPEMIKFFYLFLQRLGVPKEKIKVRLLLYPDLIDTVQKNFWSKTIGIPIEQFNRSVFIKGRHPTRRLSYGVCNIEVYSRGLMEKIMKWLELYKKELI